MRRILGRALLTALIVPFTFILAWRLVRPRRRPIVEHPRDYRIRYEEVTFPSSAGPLTAWYLPGANGRTLIGLHGIGDTRQQWLAPAARLQARGYGSLLLDFRAHGQSAGRFATYGDRETEDVAAALAYLRRRGDVAMDRVGVMGLSLGAITAILAAARLPELRAVMVEATFADLQRNISQGFTRFTGVPAFPFASMTVFWGMLLTGTRLSRLRPVAVVHQIAPRPMLIIGDLADNLVSEPESSADLFAHAGEPKELWQIADAGHVCGYKMDPDRYIDRLDAFFSAAL